MDTKHIHCMLEKIAEYGKCMIEEGVGCGNVNLCDAGQIVDMVKDLACAEKDALIAKEMRKAHEEDESEEKHMLRMLKEEYKDEYKRMREEYGEDEGERRFYDNYRYKSSGRFAPKGSGSYMPRSSGRRSRRGYEEMPYMHMYPEMYDGMTPEEMRDMDRESRNVMYYSSGGSSSAGSSEGNIGSSDMSSASSGGMRGYSEGYDAGERRGYQEGYSAGQRSERGGRSSSRYDNARRGYEESKQMHGSNTKEDNDENLKNLEKVLAVIDEDVKELMPNMTPSEKTMLKAKFSTWAQKVS